jgi:hypothetical protein
MRLFLKKILLVIAATAIFAMVLIFLAITQNYITEHVRHNKILESHQNLFNLLEHPVNTFMLATESRISSAPGNGKQCFYLVAQIRRFNTSHLEIESFYKNKTVQINFLKNNEFENMPYELNMIENWNLQKRNIKDKIYAVYTLQVNGEEMNPIDLRCL